MPKLRIAVAGAGAIGLRHVEEIAKSRSSVLSAIVDVSPHAAEVARTNGVPMYASLAEMFASGRPDGVVLATPNQLHVKHAIGTNGSLAVPTMRVRYYEKKEDRSWWKPFQTRDGLRNLRVTEAIAEAAKSGGTVNID